MVKTLKPIFLPILFSLVLFYTPAPAETGCAGARELLVKGQALEAQKLLFTQPGELDTACIDVLADASIALGDLKKAASALEELVKRDPSSLSAAARLARLYSWEGEYEASLRYYDAALALKPGDCALSVEKARVLAWAARPCESSKAYAAAEKTCGAAWVASEAAGKADLRRGRIYSAEKEYKKAVELEPGDAEALFDLAQLYSNSQVYGEAEKYYKLLAEVSPYNTSAARAREKNSAYRDNLRLEGGFSYWSARGADRMTDVRRAGFYAGPAARIGEILSASAYGTYANYSFASGAGLSERGATAALTYAPSLYWGAGASFSARSLAGRGVSGPASVYAWGRAADPLTISLALRRENLLNNRENIISGRGSASLKARADLSLPAGVSAGADLARGRADGGNYFTLAAADAKYSLTGASSLSWAETRWERSSYARGSALYFAPSVYNTYSLETAWRRYFSRGGVYYGAPHFYAELKVRETFDNSHYFSFNPRAALYAARDKYWTLKLEFSLTSSHYYRDNYWELAAVKTF
jgi:Tfp pilus assembly protein PilF